MKQGDGLFLSVKSLLAVRGTSVEGVFEDRIEAVGFGGRDNLERLWQSVVASAHHHLVVDVVAGVIVLLQVGRSAKVVESCTAAGGRSVHPFHHFAT